MKDYDFGTKWFWLAAFLLPFAICAGYAFNGRPFADIMSVFDTFQFKPFVSLMYDALHLVWPSITSPDFIRPVSWMMAVFLAHLCMDFVLFLPTVCYRAFGVYSADRGDKI